MDALPARRHVPQFALKPGWSLGGLLLRLGLLFCPLVVGCGTAAKKAWPHVAPLAKAALRPGSTTTSMGALNPRFSPQVKKVLQRLEDDGFQPRVAATWRSPDRQELIFQRGKLRQKVLGGGPATQARGGLSCHNMLDDGVRASLAADIIPGKNRKTARQKAAFFAALGQAAKAEKLGWGGRWKKRNRVWARFGLGWDPGHIQSSECTWGKRKRGQRRFLRSRR